MELPLVFMILLILNGSFAISDKNPYEISYSEIQELGASCGKLDNCKYPREEDDLGIYNCNCGEFCAELDTCCIDSPFRFVYNQTTQLTQEEELPAEIASSNFTNITPNTSIAKCRRVYGESNSEVFLVDNCRSEWIGDSFVAELCVGDGEARNDPFLLVPVTSTQTGTTYRNYFCFVCNEDYHMHVPTFWNVKIHGFVSELLESSAPRLQYSNEWNSWLMEYTESDLQESGVFLPASIELVIPDVIKSQVRACRLDVISVCSPLWIDDAIRRKCSAYMGIVRFRKSEKVIQYRNVHCAICNFENVENRWCESDDIFQERLPLPFNVLMDFNFKENNEVGTTGRCKPYHVYDEMARKCRLVTCAFTNQIYEHGKCVYKALKK